jgi:DNA-binding transcriptional LysR family regulator
MTSRYPRAADGERAFASIRAGYGCPYKADFDFSPTRWDRHRMELRHLRTIDAVARHRSFTKAAEELYLAQSAISQQIRRLERELGVEVFRRTSPSVELTAEGRVILGYAQRVLAEVDGLHSELEELTGLLRGQLRIGGVYPTGPYDLFGMLADFRAAHPGVAIHMVEDTQDDVLAALRADELDCAFTALDPDALGNEYAATLLWEEEIVIALPTGHALCSARRSPSRSSPPRISSPIARTPRCAGASSGPWPSAGSSRATRSSARRWRRCAGWRARASASRSSRARWPSSPARRSSYGRSRPSG